MSTYIRTLNDNDGNQIAPRTKFGAVTNDDDESLDEVLEEKADLVEGKVPEEQLPEMDYISNSEKGVANGVASLDGDGKVPAGQMPDVFHKNTTTVATTDWTSITAIGNYEYKAEITDVNISATKVPYVYFSETESASGIFAPFCKTENSKLIIYATEVPSASITIEYTLF